MTTTETWIPTDTFAARLTLVRKHLGMNGKEFAAKVGYDPGTLNNWEWGRIPRDLAAVVGNIADKTGVDREWLMWGIPASSIRQGWHPRGVVSAETVIDLTRPWPHTAATTNDDALLPFTAAVPVSADQQTFDLVA